MIVELDCLRNRVQELKANNNQGFEKYVSSPVIRLVACSLISYRCSHLSFSCSYVCHQYYYTEGFAVHDVCLTKTLSLWFLHMNYSDENMSIRYSAIMQL